MSLILFHTVFCGVSVSFQRDTTMGLKAVGLPFRSPSLCEPSSPWDFYHLYFSRN